MSNSVSTTLEVEPSPRVDSSIVGTAGRTFRVEVDHRTSYKFDAELFNGVQRLRLQPRSGPTQSVVDWSLEIENGDVQADYVDHLGNAVVLLCLRDNAPFVSVRATGVVETNERIGIGSGEWTGVPLWFYTRPSAYTEVGPSLAHLAESIQGSTDRLSQMHTLSGVIADSVSYQTGSTSVSTTAEEAAGLGSGVCQDHTHIFIAIARSLGVPARYVSGYLVVEDGSNHPASHAWAEAWIDNLGWIGFDVSNGVSADRRYVRLAVGRDYREAAPISGITYGTGNEQLDVSVDVHGREQ